MTDLVMARADIMSPGKYIARRREAFGLTVEDLALLIGRDREDAGRLAERIRTLEADAIALGGEAFDLVDRMKGAFAFDRTIFSALVGVATDANPDRPVPQICRVCACSWNDPCDEGGRGCAWAESDLCTACQSRPERFK